MLRGRQVEWQALGVLVRFHCGHALAADEHETLGVAHPELAHRQVEEPAVLEREVVGARIRIAPASA